MQILARAVGRRKEAVAQIQITKGTGQFIINNKPAQDYLQNNSCSLIAVKSPFLLCELLSTGVASHPLGSLESLPGAASQSPLSSTVNGGIGNGNEKELETNKKTSSLNFSFEQVDTIVKVKGGGLIGQTEAIKLGVARAICNINDFNLLKLQSSNAQSTLANLSNETDNSTSTSSSHSEPRKDYAMGYPNGYPIPVEAQLPEKANTAIALESSLTDSTSEISLEEVALQDLQIDNLFKKQLKTKGYLTQDSRIKERRKYGLKKARKASQYHKR